MTNIDKKQLVGLLNKYMDELAKTDTENKRACLNRYKSTGTKSQYEHARCIVRKLSVEIGKEMWAL